MARTYAVLGATGNAGQAILKALSSREDVQIRAFVRSKKKLESLSPELCASPSRMQVYEGSIDQVDVLERCLSGTEAAFLAVAAANNEIGCHIAQDQAACVVAALQKIREKNYAAKLPMLVVFSSAEADDKFCYDVPWAVRTVLYAANYFIYEDLKASERFFRQHSEWVDFVFMKSGGISADVQQGHILSEEASQTFVSWPDVAAGLVQLADEGSKWAGKNVSVQSKVKARPEYGNMPLLLRGLGVYARSFLPI